MRVELSTGVGSLKAEGRHVDVSSPLDVFRGAEHLEISECLSEKNAHREEAGRPRNATRRSAAVRTVRARLCGLLRRDTKESTMHLNTSDSTGRDDTGAVLVRRAVRDDCSLDVANGAVRRRRTPEAEVSEIRSDGRLALRVRAAGGRVALVETRLWKDSLAVKTAPGLTQGPADSPAVHGRRCLRAREEKSVSTSL